MASMFDTWTGGSARGGDGAQQEEPPVKLFVNRGAAGRQARQRARNSGRQAGTRRAMKERRIAQMRREEAAGRPFLPSWLR
jgi:hypothetical protein